MSTAQFVTDFGDLAVLLPIAAMILVWLLRSPESQLLAAAWALAVVFCGGAIGLLKVYFSACSTSIIDSPSGHVGMSTLVYGGLALMVAVRWRRLAVPALAVGLGVIAAIAVSRVIVGAHDTVEVLIGLAIGAVALAIFAKALIRDPLAMPAKTMLASAVLIIVLLHGQQVQAEQFFRLIGGYLHTERAAVCL